MTLRTKRILAVAALVVVGVTLAASWMVWFVGPPDPPNGGERPVDSGRVNEVPIDELRDLVRLANRAIGQLENNQLAEAERAFVEISDQLPAEVLGPRNLAIGRVLGFEQGTTQRSAVVDALERLERTDPDSAVTHWLRARTALSAVNQSPDPLAAAPELQEALAALERATQLDPENVAFHFELYEVTKSAAGENLSDRGTEALRQAYRLAPENLFVLSEWLLVQAARQENEIAATLTAAKETIAPVRRLIQKATRADIYAFTDRAIAAAEAGNWSQVLLNVRVAFVNLMRPQDFAQSDQRRLLLHPLEFVVAQFSVEMRNRLAAAEIDESERLTVRFTPLPDSWQLPGTGYVQLRLVDFNLDGQLDLLALRDDRLEVFQQTDGARWTLHTSNELAGGSLGLLVADLDHDRDRQVEEAQRSRSCFDADVDLVVFGESGITVLRNDLDRETGQRTLTAVEQPELNELAEVSAGVLVDIDHDSDLDLVLSSAGGVKVLLSEGSTTFFDASEFSELPPAEARVSSFTPVDWDHDVDIDVVLTAADPPLAGYLENLRHGNFRWVAFEESFAELATANALALFELDGNMSWDLCGAAPDGLRIVQTSHLPASTVRAVRSQHLGADPLSAVLAWDFDNSGYQDALAWGDGRLVVHRAGAGGSLLPAEELFEPPPARVIACDVGDVDADGDEDVAVATDAGIVLYANQGGNQNRWIDVRALGQVDNKGKANHNGIGSLLELKTATHYQARVVQRPVTHFGLGGDERPDVLRFLWTNGVPQAVVAPEVNQAICEPMSLKGSCPYLYAWDGERFSFVTDLLWSSPLGLQVSDGQLAPSRPWENLLIRAGQLRPVDGLYKLRVTEELWEAAYFDRIQLLAVDHPADVTVYSNEKVGPGSLAQFQIHTVRERRRPVSARDSRGRDVLAVISDRDGRYWKGFERNELPGLVDTHYLELELGELRGAEQIKLVLTGWIYPTDTSLNIAISHNPALDAPRPPSIQVPDGHGRWQEVIPYMGFPGGKTKSIVVDLSEAFLADDYRIRIVTSAEIYWDEVFFTVDESDAETRIVPLDLVSADLRYRGFSRPLPAQPNAPEIYDYADVSAAPKWPPMRGNFTRYGSVDSLLAETDDLLVVLAAGDEIALTFRQPAQQPPAGWQRDFIMHNVGWDKDADLNTIYGQTVEPLPFVGMSAYPYVGQQYPQTERHRMYLREFQTRSLNPKLFWRQIVGRSN